MINGVLTEPAYLAADMNRFLRLKPGRVARWLRNPVWDRYQDQRPDEYSFLDLIELRAIKALRAKGFRGNKLRRIYDEAKAHFGPYPFANRTFYHMLDSLAVFLPDPPPPSYKESTESGPDKRILAEITVNVEYVEQRPLVFLGEGGQLGLQDVVLQAGEELRFGTGGLATEWHPFGHESKVQITPRVAFGRPFVATGVTTEAIYSLFLGEGRDMGAVVRWLTVTEQEARDAVAFEESMRTAA